MVQCTMLAMVSYLGTSSTMVVRVLVLRVRTMVLVLAVVYSIYPGIDRPRSTGMFMGPKQALSLLYCFYTK